MKLATSIWQYFTGVVLKPLLIIFAGLKVEGTHFLEVINGPVIFIANHRSIADPFIMATAVPFKHHKYVLPFRFATKIAEYNRPYFKPFLKLWGCFPVAPKSGSLEHVLRGALDLIKDREQSIVYFPEGKVWKEERQHPARPGIAYLARQSGWLIIPVGVSGTLDLSWFKFFTFRNRITIRFGQPFYYHEIARPDDDLIEVAHEMMSRVYKLVNGNDLAVKEFVYS